MMKKITYVRPLIEVMEMATEDIIRTSGLTNSVGSITGGNATGSKSSYDDAYNLSGGGKITLN